MQKPTPVWLFRITHIDNLRHIIRNGLVCEKSSKANPDFRNIGDSSLIDFRKNFSHNKIYTILAEEKHSIEIITSPKELYYDHL